MDQHESIESVWEEQEEQEKEAQAQARLAETLQLFGVRLTKLAEEQVANKADIEKRMLDGLRAYHGKYDETTLKGIKANKGSEIFVNITRHKCNTAEARLIDMLFPNDDKNWSINSTPIPELKDLSQSERVITYDDGRKIPESDIAREAIAEAEKKAKAMERTIEDQLIETSYAAKCRDAIHDAVIFGTGIIKAPVVEGRLNKRWDIQEDGTATLVIEESLEPSVEVVSPWDYFPDMSARNKEECAFEYERKFLNRRQAKDLLKLPGVLEDQLMSVLLSDPDETEDDRFDEVRQISGDSVNVTRSRYTLWEYHGEIEPEELESAGIETGDGLGMSGTVLILNGKVIRVSLNPLDTEESPYSVFNWEVDANSLFGFGVPYLAYSPQTMMNAATRMMMDNARVSLAPQIAMNKKFVKPADGDWTFQPFKRWEVTDDNVKISDAINFFNVPSNQADLSAIYNLSRMMVDEQTSLPAVATGEGDPNAAPQTATGTAIQSGAAKVVFKRVVKNFDDDLTVPTIKRFYAWNMQYNDNKAIKGDMQVNARGSSSLMVKEQEAALIGEALRYIPPEELMMRHKPGGLLKEFYRSRNVNPTEILKSDEEYEADVEKMKEASQGQANPEMQKLQMQMQIESQKLQQKQMQLQLDAQRFQAEAQQKEQQMIMQYEMEMSKLAAQQQTTVEKLKLDSGAIEMKAMLDQMKEQNRKEIADMQNATQRQIAAIKAQQETNKQAMQATNLMAGHDTF